MIISSTAYAHNSVAVLYVVHHCKFIRLMLPHSGRTSATCVGACVEYQVHLVIEEAQYRQRVC